jgi:chorismate mutase / prephenate dehydratase
MSKNNNSLGLEKLRQQIDEIDERLLELFANRRQISAEVIKAKAESATPVRDFEREEQLLRERIATGGQLGLDRHFITKIFQEIIDDSVRTQHLHLLRQENLPKDLKIAYNGISGSYCQLALLQHFTRRQISQDIALQLLGFPTFSEVINALNEGRVKYALVPIENTTRGSINEVSELIIKNDCYIVGEEKLRIDHCLLGMEPINIKSLKKIYCSYFAALDCRTFLDELNLPVEIFTDSAIAAKTVIDRQDKFTATIASSEAAQIYGLEILKRGISDTRDNYVRSLLLSKTQESFDIRIPCKTAIIFATAHNPGALVENLLIFKKRGINLTKLDSYPVPDNPWEELFYLDFSGNLLDQNVADAIHELSYSTRLLRTLGSFPAIDIPKCELTPNKLNVLNTAKEKSANQNPKQGEESEINTFKRTEVSVGSIIVGGGNFEFFIGSKDLAIDQLIPFGEKIKCSGFDNLVVGDIQELESRFNEKNMNLNFADFLSNIKGCGLNLIGEFFSASTYSNFFELQLFSQQSLINVNLQKQIARSSSAFMLLREPSSSRKEFLEAVDKFLLFGNHQLILCDKGQLALGSDRKFVIDMATLSRLRESIHLPIIVDLRESVASYDECLPIVTALKVIGINGVMLNLNLEEDLLTPLTFEGLINLAQKINR